MMRMITGLLVAATYAFASPTGSTDAGGIQANGINDDPITNVVDTTPGKYPGEQPFNDYERFPPQTKGIGATPLYHSVDPFGHNVTQRKCAGTHVLGDAVDIGAGPHKSGYSKAETDAIFDKLDLNKDASLSKKEVDIGLGVQPCIKENAAIEAAFAATEVLAADNIIIATSTPSKHHQAGLNKEQFFKALKKDNFMVLGGDDYYPEHHYTEDGERHLEAPPQAFPERSDVHNGLVSSVKGFRQNNSRTAIVGGRVVA